MVVSNFLGEFKRKNVNFFFGLGFPHEQYNKCTIQTRVLQDTT